MTALWFINALTSMKRSRYIWNAVSLVLTAAISFAHPCFSQQAFDSFKVRAALQNWTGNIKDFDRRRPTVLFTTSTMGCTPCCATAINHAISTLSEDKAEANILVVVATPLPREGLAIRKKFKTPNVAEDAEGVLDTVFRADMVLPDMYIIDLAGKVRLRHHDLQHNMIDTLHYAQYLTPDLPQDQGQAVAPESVAPDHVTRLQEDDDHIISELRSEYMDAEKGTLEFLETRQNAIYRFSLTSGALLKVVPADESLALRLRDPDNRQDFWEDFSGHQSAMIAYESIAHPSHTDTSYIAAQLYTRYVMEIDSSKKIKDPAQPLDTILTFYKSQCLLKMLNDSVVGVDSIPESPWLMVGSTLPLGRDFLTPCLWEGLLRSSVNAQDSAYAFLIIQRGSHRPIPALRIADIEKLSRRPYNPRVFGPMCISGKGDLFYVNQRNGVFLKGRRDGESIMPVLLRVGGSLRQARSFSALDTSRFDPAAPPDENLYVADVSTNDRQVHMLVLHRAESDRQLEVQAYDMKGRYLNASLLHTGEDPILSASIIGYNDERLFMLLKQKKTRWTVASIPLKTIAQ